MKRLAQQTDLSWALADTARPYLCAVERNHVYAAIGAGETFTAIGGSGQIGRDQANRPATQSG